MKFTVKVLAVQYSDGWIEFRTPTDSSIRIDVQYVSLPAVHTAEAEDQLFQYACRRLPSWSWAAVLDERPIHFDMWEPATVESLADRESEIGFHRELDHLLNRMEASTNG